MTILPTRSRHRSLPDRTLVWPALVAVAVMVAASPAAAQRGTSTSLEGDLSIIETEVVGLERRISALRADVSTGSLTRSPRIISERFAEAKYAYLVDDHERCALIFYSLLANDDLKGDPRRSEAQWYIAECLFLDGNLRPAQTQFQRIVEVGPAHPFYGNSLLKLIELFGRTGDVMRFSEYYDRFMRSSIDDSPTALRIRYEMGKTLYRQGEFVDAQNIFGTFPRGSTYTPQARYFSATIIVAEGQLAATRGNSAEAKLRYEQALGVFREVLTLPTSTSEHRRVRDLSHLAIGRLYYETGDIPSAISEYTQVGADSDYYSDALYETIWANVEAASQIAAAAEDPTAPVLATDFERTRKYEEALRAIEIFNLVFPEDAREPTLKLLAGHVRVRMEKFEAAIERYEKAADDFRELKQVVDQIVGSGADPMVYFNQLVDEEFIAEADLTVPDAARRQARSDEQVAEAVAVSGDLYRQEDAIDDAADVLDILEAALYQEDSQGLIQTYRINRQHLSMAEASGLLLRSRLVDIEIGWLEANLPPARRADLEALRTDQEAAQSAAASVSERRTSLQGKREDFNLQAQAVETRIYHLELGTKDLMGRLSAIEEYLVDARNRLDRTRAQELEARREIEAEKRLLVEILDQLHELKKRLEPRVLTARLGSDMAADEGPRRTDARGRLARVEGELGRLRGTTSSGGDFFRRLDSARSRLLDLERVGLEARDLMNRAEAAEIDDIKDEVRFQRRMVGSLDEEAGVISESNRHVSGRIGTHAFAQVAQFYEDMLTRADMGVADVYWYRKETTGKEREDLAREKVRRLRALEAAFDTLLGPR